MTIISTLGSHSALDVCDGAKAEGFRTLVVCQRGREKTYAKYYKTRKRGKDEVGIVDEILLVDKFKEIVEQKNQKLLTDQKAIFVPNRSFAVYVGYDAIEKDFNVPVFGNKYLLRAEERDAPKNQYFLLKEAGIDSPRTVKPEEIEFPVLVKVNEAGRSYERAFFFAASHDEYIEKSESLLKRGVINEEGLKKARIEEFVLGAQFNFNFFYSPLKGELELLGIDMRRQTNLDGVLRLPAQQQMEVLKHERLTTVEVGHIACTLRESLLEKVFDAGEKFVAAVKKHYKNGIIGPFALQSALEEKEGKERIVVFDVSFRMPGSPGTRFTPYSEYLFRKSIGFGRRIAIEIKEAEKAKEIERITT
ncbi:MAG: formate--phosphoribosylaminoimidazolecarboxamide ligase family protein [Candidatus Bilamarchaeaceae archaeon]